MSWTNYGMDNIERDCGLQENPYEPEEAKHHPDAEYIVCDECGHKIWNDTEEDWFEGKHVICHECLERGRKEREIFG